MEQTEPIDAPSVQLLLTIPDAARALSIGRSTFYELIADGTIEVVHIGRSARVPVAALADYVDRLRTADRGTTVRATTKWPGPSANPTRASRPPAKPRRPTS